MWVIYRISDKQIMGSTVDAGVKITKDQALHDVVSGLVGRPDIKGFDAIEIKEDEDQEILFRAMGGARVVNQEDGSLAVADGSAQVAEIQVTTDARDFHPVDGVPLLAGDGESFLVVTLQRVGLTVTTSVASKTVEAAMAIIGGGIESPPPDGGDKEAD